MERRSVAVGDAAMTTHRLPPDSPRCNIIRRDHQQCTRRAETRYLWQSKPTWVCGIHLRWMRYHGEHLTVIEQLQWVSVAV